jgi:PQQ-dependent catabolism-associated CXXCW motif protein
MRLLLAATISLGLALPGAAQSPEPPAAPDGYRQDAYRAPVPATLPGATVVGPEAAFALWKTGRVAFVDVLPRSPKPELPEGTLWHEPPHASIAGAIWLANVGYGELAGVMHDYFRGGLEKMTGGDLDYPVVFFCLPECWMSWNAGKRAITEYGLTHVFWFPEGATGWEAAGYPVEVLEPEPGGR